jgi:hypothetical protein
LEPEKDPSLRAQKPSLLLGLLGTLALVFGALALSKMSTPNNYSSKSVHPGHTPENESERSESTPREMLMLQSPNDSPKPHERRRRETPWWEKAAVVIALLLFVANSFQGWQTKNAANAARDAADAAQKANILTGEATRASIGEFRLEHRAWMAIDGLMFFRTSPDGSMSPVSFQQIKPNDLITLDVEYKNFGSTPAFNEKSGARSEDFPSDKNPKFQPITLSASAGAVQPNAGMFQLLDGWPPIRSDALAELRDRKRFLFVHGRMEYDDAFGIHHWNTFCRILRPSGGWSACPDRKDEIDNNPEEPPPPPKP